MIVHNPCHLHKGVNDSRTYTTEPSLHQIFAYDFSFWRLHRYLASITESVSYGLVAHKAPAVVTEGTKLLLNLQKCKGIIC